jgi:phosphatidylglycerophosphate synthase
MTDDSASPRARVLKERDSWWTVLVIDPVAMRLLPLILRIRWATPTRITATALVLGAASATAFATGLLVVGAILFEVRYLVDCLDGKVARARDAASDWGRFADLAGDVSSIAACYAALGFWMWVEGVPGSATTLALLASYAAATWLHLYRRLALGEEERVSPAGGWTARTWPWGRLRPYPGSTEVETVVLFLFPLLLPVDWFAPVGAAATAFYVISALDSARRVRRALRDGPMPSDS